MEVIAAERRAQTSPGPQAGDLTYRNYNSPALEFWAEHGTLEQRRAAAAVLDARPNMVYDAAQGTYIERPRTERPPRKYLIGRQEWEIPFAEFKRGKVTFSRRRYGTTTYTWGFIEVEGTSYQLEDPYPAVIFPKREIEHSIRAIHRRAVMMRLKRGLYIPASVLADYPDLQGKGQKGGGH